MRDIVISDPAILGSGGGGGGGKGGNNNQNSGGQESPNTLRSNARIRMIEALGEGPIVGLVAGPKSIYFDNTPLQNSDGTFNFGGEIHGGSGSSGSGVVYEERYGYADQPPLSAIPMAETPFSVDVRVKFSNAPPVRTISEQNADAVRVTVRIPALCYQNRQNGNLEPASVAYAIEVRPSGGNWYTADGASIDYQKCTSPYVRTHRVVLPAGGYPWEIRVRRLTADADVVELQNETWWESYTVLTEGKFIYPDTALIALQCNAQEFGSSVPARTYDVKGLIIKVPSNYDPETRLYFGMWDGSFKMAWTNNPAWVLYDLLTNPRYGLGEFVEDYRIDKWGLYSIGQYCDQLVPSGFRNSITGLPILEPRFSFNGVINSRDEAYKVIQDITQAFRGMAYWSMGQVMAVADMPVDAVKIVTPANVIGGHFQYSGTAMKARHSVALVKWNDPQDFYRPGVELVQNDDMLQRFGWRQIEVQAKGCTSRGQAHRFGKWILDTEQHETELVEYSCSWDQADLLPGQIIMISDPRKAQVRAGGRLKFASLLEFELDQPFLPVGSNSYRLIATMPDGKTFGSNIAEFVASSQEPNGGYRRVRVAQAFPQVPLVGAMWVISGTDVEPMRFRVLSIREEEKHIFRVTALFHDPTKYQRVEQGLHFDPPPYTRPKREIRPPVNLRAVESLFYESGVAKARISLSWTPSDDFMAVGYIVSAQTPDGYKTYGQFSGTSCDISDTRAGNYTFFVSAVSVANFTSQPARLDFTAIGWEGLDGPFVSHLELFGRGSDTTFTGRDPKFIWRNNFPGVSYDPGNEPNGAGTGDRNPYYRDNVVRIFDIDTNELLRTHIVGVQEFVYAFAYNYEDNLPFGRGPLRRFRIEVTVRDTLGRESKPAKLVVENPVPDIVVPTVRPGIGQVFVDYPLSQDLDAQGALIWLSKDRVFDPLETPVAYDGINNFVTLKADQFETYYVRMAIYDAFGRDGLNICPPIEVVVDGFKLDTEPPAVPTGLALEASVERNASGDLQTRLVATWDASPSENFGRFDVEIRRQNGNWLSFATTNPRFEWTGLVMNELYEVRVRAQSRLNYASGFSTVVSITMPANQEPPAAPSGLSGVASLRSVFLKWNNPAEPDLAAIEIWSGISSSRDEAIKIGESLTNVFTHSGLTTGETRFYWVRARNTSGLVSEFNALAGISVTPGQVAEGDIAANAIIADHIRAGVIVGDHLSINTYLPASITVGETGVSIGTVQARADDPAGRINQKSTQIDPGKILISGDTTLANWRSGTDQTKIAGGSIAANSIAANSLVVGLRGLDIGGLTFSFVKDENLIRWTEGTIYWTADDGTKIETEIDAGEALWESGTLYIAWQKGATTLTTSESLAAVTGADWVGFGTYRGGVSMIVNYGRTLIDGDSIVAGSIRAQNLYAGELITEVAQIRGGLIQNVHLAGSITFDKMAGGLLSTSEAIRVGGDRFVLQATDQVLRITDGNNTLRALLGKTGTEITDYGLKLFDETGSLIFGSGGFSAGAIPASALQTIPESQISGLGSFARISQLNAGNISTYMASAAISSAYIANLHGDKITANTITADKINVNALSAITANIGAITAGSLNINNRFLVGSDGSVYIQNSASGARLIITNSVVMVIDANGVLRVRMGIW